ncbi:lipid asymmetry maintenance protein MlaB [Streptomyces sp. NPDC001822]|uniref:STAS domain-containing protein n=1 Tax=Streptomyces sp. NPDC001822 TaxID=3364614 RepID=UPI0036AB86DA
MTPSAALVVTGRVTRADVPGLCAELEALLTCRPDAAVIDCDVGGVTHADLALVEAIARLGLVARRTGRARLRLRRPSAELGALLDLVGLADVVALLGPDEE